MIREMTVHEGISIFGAMIFVYKKQSDATDFEILLPFLAFSRTRRHVGYVGVRGVF